MNALNSIIANDMLTEAIDVVDDGSGEIIDLLMDEREVDNDE